MGITITHSVSDAALVDKYVNTAFDKVKTVADNINDVKIVANDIDKVNLVAEQLDGVDIDILPTITDAILNHNLNVIGDNFEVIDEVYENLTHITGVNNNKINIDNVAGNKTNVDKVAARHDDIQELADELDNVSGSFVDYVEDRINNKFASVNVDTSATNSIYNIVHTAGAGQTTFAIPQGSVTNPASIQVYVNGVLQNGFSGYTVAGNLVTLVESLTAGDTVSIFTSNSVLADDMDNYVINLTNYSNVSITHTVNELTVAGAIVTGYTYTAVNLSHYTYNMTNANNISVFVNGIYKQLSRDYYLEGTTLVFTSAVTGNDRISVITNRTSVSSSDTVQFNVTLNTITVTANNPIVVIDNGVTTVNVSGTFTYVPNANQLLVFINGVLQDPNAYTEVNAYGIVITEELMPTDIIHIYKIVPSINVTELSLPNDIVRTTGVQTVSNKTVQNSNLSGITTLNGSVVFADGSVINSDINLGTGYKINGFLPYEDTQAFKSHINTSAHVHGIGSGNAVVGTNTTQTLTNKTIAAPTITGSVSITGFVLTTPTTTPTHQIPITIGGEVYFIQLVKAS